MGKRIKDGGGIKGDLERLTRETMGREHRDDEKEKDGRK